MRCGGARATQAVPSPEPSPELPMLDDKRLLITGVLTRNSIAYAVAERAQALGAHVILTGFGKTRRMTERSARSLDPVPEVLELDATSVDDFHALADHIQCRWGGVDGALHAIAGAPMDAIG